MDGFVTLAVGQPYLDRAVAFALSARRFGYPVVLMHKHVDLARCTDIFHTTVDISEYPVLNQRPPCSIWELKRHAWTVTSEFQRCAYCDADSLVIRDPGPMFDLADPVHRPDACDISDTIRWAIPPFVDSTMKLGLELGIRPPVQTLNGGFFVWERSASAQRWFEDWAALQTAISRIYKAESRADVRDELCMAFAFAKQEIRLSRSDSSIGLWDARNLTLDIQEQRFECNKGFYWQGHRFNPYIAHFGGGTISHQYRDSVHYLLKDSGIELPVFEESLTDASRTSLRSREKFNGYSVSREECERLVEFVKSNGVRTVLEIGPGASTWYLADAGCEVWSVESDREWYEHYRQEFADVPNVHVLYYVANGELTIPETDDRRFDMAFVDAPPGHNYHKCARINSALYAAHHSDMWILHDTRRKGEQSTVSVFEDLGWSVESIPARAGLTIFTRKSVEGRSRPSPNTVRQPPNLKAPSTPSEAKYSRAYDFSHWNTLPKVSCQCITYGRPHLLNEAVEAFLRQDYPGESELVILNDHTEITICNPGIENVTTINVPHRIRSVGEK